jgi:hypothetical protein
MEGTSSTFISVPQYVTVVWVMFLLVCPVIVAEGTVQYYVHTFGTFTVDDISTAFPDNASVWKLFS